MKRNTKGSTMPGPFSQELDLDQADYQHGGRRRRGRVGTGHVSARDLEVGPDERLEVRGRQRREVPHGRSREI